MRVAKLVLRGFRGATLPVVIPFDPTAPITLIYGENGTGKSTIVDGFDFICNHNYGSLENYSLGTGETARKHVTSLGGVPEHLAVRITADDGTIFTATLGRRGPSVSPEEGCPDAHILRRRDVTNVIEAPPAKRYDALKDYLLLPGVEKSEEALRSAVRTYDRRFDGDASMLAQAQDALMQLWQEEGRPGQSAQDWAMAQASQDVSELREALEELTRVETALRSAQEARELLDRAGASHRQTRAAHAQAQQQQRQVSAQTDQAAELLALLRDAASFVGAYQSIRSCPVCEQPVDAAGLHDRLQQRISRAAELMAAMEATTAAETQLTSSGAVMDRARETFCERVRALLRQIRSTRLDEVLAAPLAWDRYMMLAREGEASEPAEEQARAALTDLGAFQHALAQRLESTQRTIAQHGAIRLSAERVDKLQERVAQQRLVSNRLKDILEVVSTERKRYAEDILDAVAEDVGTLYAGVHPDEPLGRIRFSLKRQATGSIELDAGFQDRDDLPPQAYYSESHLDTLGICVFLAMAKRFRTDRSIVMLDDVLTAVDAPHVDRFMAMLQAQAPHLNQLIITTHERHWAERYRHDPSVSLLELGEWTLDEGLRLLGPS